MAMKKVMVFSMLLIVGMVSSQFLPDLVGSAYAALSHLIRLLTMAALAFIMIHVGYEFDINKHELRRYGWDYVVAMTAAAFPWIFVCGYFIFVMLPPDVWSSWQAWKEALLASRFAAPTSAGVLFAMLAAAGLSATWLFRKARILAIFDDLDTVLLMIPLKMLMVGLAWQLGLIVVFMAGLLWLAWHYLHRWALPVTWPWVLGYAGVIAGVSEVIYVTSKVIDDTVPIHIEVLLPAFVLGCLLHRPAGHDPHLDDTREGHQEGPESPQEQRVATLVAAVFMVLVGLSMPPLFVDVAAAGKSVAATVSAAQPIPSWGMITLHVLALTALANLGKMFPLLCYRRQAHWKERLALAIGLWPRGEVGAGVLIVSLSYGIGGPIVTVAMLCLALNLILTGGFIFVVKRLVGARTPTDVTTPTTQASQAAEV
jgi:Kef-type K+ transport system membrane component KefB